MEIFANYDTLILFLAFFVPGFIALQVYSLLVPTESPDFSKNLFQAVGLSSLNYALLYWLFLLCPPYSPGRPYVDYFVIFIAPALLPFAFLKLQQVLPFATLSPMPKAWDWVFSKRQRRWIIVHLRDGNKIGGWFGENSYASAYPAPEQIYLETAWQVDEAGNFIRKVELSRGVIINGSDILAVDLRK